MKHVKLQEVILGGSPDDIKAALYEALQTGDIEPTLSCWAEEDDVICVHPGRRRMMGTTTMRRRFKVVLSHNNAISRVFQESPHKIKSLAGPVHHVTEKIEIQTPLKIQRAFVIATNAHHKTPQAWRMASYHACLDTAHDGQDLGAEPSGLY